MRQVFRRTVEAARALAEAVGADYTTLPEEIVTDARLYIVSLTDSALVELAPRLAACKSGLMVHTAGSIPMKVWKGAARHYGVLYPMQTFSKRRAVDFLEIPFFVEANTMKDQELLVSVARLLSDRVFDTTS